MEAVRRSAAVVSLAIGIFVLITIEELPIGVLSVMAPDLGVSEGLAGLTVTAPGVLAGVVAVVTPVLIRGWDRRLVLVTALVCVVLSCSLSVVAPNFAVLLAARLFAGIAIGLYWAVMPIVALGQVPGEQAAKALTLAFGGAGAALVMGVPLAAWIGAQLGWREAFGVVGLLSAAVAVALLVLVRPVRATVPVTPGMMRDAARSRAVQHALALTALVVTAQFISYSYVSPLLHDRAGIPVTRIGLMLLLFGIAGLIGNFAVSLVLRRSSPAGVLVVTIGLGLALTAVLLLMRSPGSASVIMPLWGLFAGAISVTIQAFVTTEAHDVVEEGTALNSAAFNVAIAAGALIGGAVLESAGRSAMLVTSIVLVGLGVAVATRYLLTAPRTSSPLEAAGTPPRSA